jgi:hypothetical protein
MPPLYIPGQRRRRWLEHRDGAANGSLAAGEDTMGWRRSELAWKFKFGTRSCNWPRAKSDTEHAQSFDVASARDRFWVSTLQELGNRHTQVYTGIHIIYTGIRRYTHGIRRYAQVYSGIRGYTQVHLNHHCACYWKVSFPIVSVYTCNYRYTQTDIISYLCILAITQDM